MAGADPVATAIRTTILYTTTNPRIYNRLMAEFAAYDLLLSTTSLPSYDSLRKLPYLTAIIKESLRIHPPYVGLLEKAVPEGGDYLPDGRYLPAGTLIGSNIWAVQRDRTTFGVDAEVFRPERWLECEPEQRNSMERSVELCFSSGRYTCLGKEVAMMEIYKAVAEVSFCDGRRGWRRWLMAVVAIETV
ncbi:MAG: hypothetical protein Q9195_006458 [Heterodermia aff. obscurata]